MDGVRESGREGEGATGGIALGSIWGREVGGRSSSPHRGPYGRLRELRCAGWRENTQQGTLSTGLARVCGDLRLSGGWVADGAVRPGVEWLAAGPRRGLNFSAQGQRSGKMQGQPACRAGEPSGQGEEPPPEGLGGGYPLSQTDPRRPAARLWAIVLDGQPGAVGGEAARERWFSPTPYLRSRMAFSISAWRRWSASSSSNSPSRSVMKP